MDKGEAITNLKERMTHVPTLPDEPDFTTSDETIVRFLKANEWKYKESESGLLQTVEYRRQQKPLRVDCRWCHERPGYHSMRQIGHDESGRPVVYANFAQAIANKNTVEDIVNHVTFLIENAKATMGTGTTTWVFVIDCTGITLKACSPKMGLNVSHILASHYPERLGMVVCVNHNPVFHGFWKAIKKFLQPSTVAKMRLIRSESKICQAFSTFFPEDVATWLLEEMALNKQKPLAPGQRMFWNPPATQGVHDPRGAPSYVDRYVAPFSAADAKFVQGVPKKHIPHPNIASPPGSDRILALTSEVKEADESGDEAGGSACLYDDVIGLDGDPEAGDTAYLGHADLNGDDQGDDLNSSDNDNDDDFDHHGKDSTPLSGKRSVR